MNFADEPPTLHAAAAAPEITQTAGRAKLRINLKKPTPTATDPTPTPAPQSKPVNGERQFERQTEERQRLEFAHTLAQTLLSGIEAEQQAPLEQPSADEPVGKRFKRHIGVEPGSTLRALEAEERVKDPTVSRPVAAARARTTLKAKEKKSARLQWQGPPPDTSIVASLNQSRDPATEQLVAEFEAAHTKLDSRTPEERAVQTSLNDLRRKSKKRVRFAAATAASKANELLTGQPVVAAQQQQDENAEALQIQITDRSTFVNPPLATGKTIETDAGLVVRVDPHGDTIRPGLYPLAHFGMLYAAAKSRSEEALSNDAAGWLARFHATTVDGFLKVVDSAPSDACLTVDGERASGSVANDLRKVLSANGYDANFLSNERLLRYQELWQQTHTEVPADTEQALAVRSATINRERAVDVMRKLGMDEAEIKSAMVHGRAAEFQSFMRAVFASINSEAFLNAENQAEEETYLARRVKLAMKKNPAAAAAAAAASTTTTGGRGREALGMSIHGTDPQPTPKTLGVSLEIVDRAYILANMRPAIYEGERPCVRGELCLCNTLASSFPAVAPAEGRGSGFTCKEFLLPSQLSTYRAHGKLPEHRLLCVICDRAAVTAMVYENIERRQEPTVPLHAYAVEIDVPGGYRRDLLLEPMCCGTRLTGIIAPFPAFNVQHLIFGKFNVDGRQYNCLTETGTDFRTGSASTQRI